MYRLTIPWVWLVTAIISWRHPGDEYGLFGIANGLPSAMVSLWIIPGLGLNPSFALMIACSAISMILLSWILDRLRVPVILLLPLYLSIAAFLVYSALSGYESYQRALSKNGSLTAYVSAASNLGLFLSAVLCILIFSVRRGIQAWRRSPVAS